MHYYLLDNSKDRRFRPVGEVYYTPCAESGWAVSVSMPREYCADHERVHVSDVNEAVAMVPQDRELADKLRTFPDSHVFSERMKAVVDSLHCNESLAYLPVRVVDESGKHRANYWMAYPAQSYYPLDDATSEFSYWEHNPNRRHQVLCWSLDPSKVPEQDLFYADDVASGYHWICTDNFRNAVITHGFTGCHFEQIGVF